MAATASAPGTGEAPSPTGVNSSASTGAPDPSLGVAGVEWPTTLRATARLLSAAPDRVQGRPRSIRTGHVDGADSGDTVTLDYSSAGAADQIKAVAGVRVAFSWTSAEDGAGEPFSPAQLLGASFGLLASCTDGSYIGTLPARDAARTGPTFEHQPTDQVLWFACAAVEDPGAPSSPATGTSTGPGTRWTMGWTSSNAAWSATAADRATVERLVTTLVAAR